MSTVKKISVVELSVDDLIPHPLQSQIRPYSAKYKTYVHDEWVETIINSMKDRKAQGESPFDPYRPIFVRPSETGQYEVFNGWTRTTAAKNFGCKVFAVIKENISEADLAIQMLTTQGKDLDVWAMARHAYYCCIPEQKIFKPLMRVSEYARNINRDASRVNKWLKAAEVEKNLKSVFGDELGIPITHAEILHGIDPEEAEWFVEKVKSNDWSKATLQIAINAANELKVPEELSDWINPIQHRKDVAEDAVDNPQPVLLNQYKRYIQAAITIKNDLPTDRLVWEFDRQNRPKQVAWNLQERYIALLPTKVPISGTDIIPKLKSLSASITKEVLDLDEKFTNYQRSQLAAKEIEQVEQAKKEALIQQERIYTPVGIKENITVVDLGVDVFDATFMWQPDEYPEGWEKVIVDTLKPTGYLASIFNNISDLFAYEDNKRLHKSLEFVTVLHWIFPSVEKQQNFHDDVRYIHIAQKPGRDGYDGYNAIHRKYKGERLSCILPDMKEPEELAEYLITAFVPPRGNIFEPYAKQLAAFSRIAKQNEIRSTFLVEGKDYNLTVEKIEETPFPWN